jgi:hypothetical protein
MRAKPNVPWGGSLHSSGGEISSPRREYLSGIISPAPKAGLVSLSHCGVGVGGKGVAVGVSVGVGVLVGVEVDSGVGVLVGDGIAVGGGVSVGAGTGSGVGLQEAIVDTKTAILSRISHARECFMRRPPFHTLTV